MKTQNALKEHKKLYKSGRSWVIGTVFTSVLGGALFLNTVNANADSTAQSAAVITAQQAQATSTAPAFTASATLSKTYDEQLSDWNQSEAAYSAAQSSANAAIASESAANQSEAASYQAQLDNEAAQQKAADSAAYAAAQQSTAASNAALKASQTAAYNAASTAAANSLAAMPQQSTSAGEAGNGGTLSYVEQTGDFSNVITHTDANTVTWNGNYLIPSLPVASDSQLYDQNNDTSMRLIKDDGSVKNSIIPAYAASDMVVNNQLTAAQQTEMNTYLLKLLNQYREKLGIADLNSTAAMLATAIERGTTLTTGQMEHNSTAMAQAAADNNVGSLAECLGGLNTAAMQGNNKTLSMLELMNSAASSLNDMLNSDNGSDWGHRNIFLSNGSTSGFVSGNGAFSLEYNTTLGEWIMNFNADSGSTGTSVVNDTPAAQSLPSTGDNSAYEAAKAQSDKTLSNLAATQATTYNNAVSASQAALASLKSSQEDSETNTVFSNSSKLMSYVNGLTSKLNTLISTLQAQVDALNPGAKPVDTGNTGSGDSSASSSAGSSASSDGSSAASSAGSSASSAGSDNSSAASSAGSSASSAGSDDSSAASSAGSSSSSAGSDDSSAAGSAGNGNSTASSAASSANSAVSTATQTSSAASSANSESCAK